MTPHEKFYRERKGYFPTREEFLRLDKEGILKWFELTEEWYVIELQRVALQAQEKYCREYGAKLDTVKSTYAHIRMFPYIIFAFVCGGFLGGAIGVSLMTWSQK